MNLCRMNFEFATATRIIFGSGVIEQAGSLASRLGRNACVVTGSTSARAAPLIEGLRREKISYLILQVRGEPTTAGVLELVDEARKSGCDLVIGLGGGSVLDTGKVLAALLANRGDLFDYLEVIGKGKKLGLPAAPYIAIPTTAGTGAEVTRNAVLLSPEHRVKVSLRDRLILPRLALVDPRLTTTMPPEVTAATGLDAFTQLLEPFVSPRGNPLTDAICREGLKLSARSLLRVYRDGADAGAREDISLAALLGGLALANAGLGAVHGLAGPLGGMFPAPHGALCARLLAYVMEANLRALRERAPGSPALSRYREAARIVTGNPRADAAEGAAWVRGLCEALKIASLSSFGVETGDLAAVTEKAEKSSSMKGNPIPLTPDELLEVLRRAL